MVGEAAQQPQVTPEMLKKLQGEEKKEKANTASGSIGNNHWIVKMGKDVAYLSFFPWRILWNAIVWTLSGSQKDEKKEQTININENKNNSVTNNASTSQDQDGNIRLEEVAPPDLTATNAKQSPNDNQWTENIAHQCRSNDEPAAKAVKQQPLTA